MAMTLDRQDSEGLEVVAGNGLLDRRAFLRSGAAVAGTVMGYTFVRSAAAAPLADDPWSLGPGGRRRPDQLPSRFRGKIARTPTNPNRAPPHTHARTPPPPHHSTLY